MVKVTQQLVVKMKLDWRTVTAAAATVAAWVTTNGIKTMRLS
jgi:hypothetical protein